MTPEHVELVLTELAFHERTCQPKPHDPEQEDVTTWALEQVELAGSRIAYLHAQQIIRRIVELAAS